MVCGKKMGGFFGQDWRTTEWTFHGFLKKLSREIPTQFNPGKHLQIDGKTGILMKPATVVQPGLIASTLY
jgi:hypothetical protein